MERRGHPYGREPGTVSTDPVQIATSLTWLPPLFVVAVVYASFLAVLAYGVIGRTDCRPTAYPAQHLGHRRNQPTENKGPSGHCPAVTALLAGCPADRLDVSRPSHGIGYQMTGAV
ncbi:hypothetical protein Airi02_019040 [Actinoallomurus iriomotensis]|uniref:Uncharacterized protein n=1 Tax=Actinoallomurus iriomotensis TaxID=478107 RepID=A0A9W6VXK6_9ACTN|nr:hypothetical protein Airi02_019040 [Actinoallomurus iriomotensis]